jgi:hypothetical protein
MQGCGGEKEHDPAIKSYTEKIVTGTYFSDEHSSTALAKPGLRH